MMRVALLGSPEKPLAGEIMERTRRWLAGRAEVVFAQLTFQSAQALERSPDLLFVFGGDGTVIAAAHGLRDRQVPIVGINLGKVGYLAEFTLPQLEREGDFLFNGELPVTRRVMLSARMECRNGVVFESMAVNDCVVVAGPPFRIVELRVDVDDDQVAELRCDGLIIATASGSTAHNLSAGGPILEPTAQAFILTPICPHALTFRPLAINAGRRIAVTLRSANPGTMLVVDGHHNQPFQAGDHLTLSRYPADFLLVRNPRRSVWYSLRRKLMWGENPKMRE